MQIFSDDILKKLELITKDYNHLCELLTYEEVLLDNKLCTKYQKDLDKIQPIANKYQNILNLQQQLDTINLTDFHTEQEKLFFEQEQNELNKKITILQSDVLKLLDNLNAELQSVTLEIAKGNDTFAEQFKNDIVLGYQNFCNQNGFEFDVVNQSQNTIFNISGLNAKNIFKSQAGLHIANQGNQQSTCKVFVYESFDVAEPTFSEQDIKIEVCRSSGAGGQHINTTDSSIKITHIKTGITAVCQDQRSQFQNKQKAMQNLKTKVLDYYNNQKTKFVENQKKEQVKLIKQNYVAKIYDYDSKIIKSKKDNKQISFDAFLSGNDL